MVLNNFNLINLFYVDKISCKCFIKINKFQRISETYPGKLIRNILSDYKNLFIKANGIFIFQVHSSTKGMIFSERSQNNEINIHDNFLKELLESLNKDDNFIFSIISIEKKICLHIDNYIKKHQEDSLNVIQHIAYPTYNFPTSCNDMFAKGDYFLLFEQNSKVSFVLARNDICDFSTYFNIFELKKWKDKTIIENLFLSFSLVGNIVLRVKSITPQGIITIYSTIISSDYEQEFNIEIPTQNYEIIGVQFDAVDASVISNCSWKSNFDTNQYNPKLAICITAFNEPDALENCENLINEINRINSDIDYQIFLIDNSSTLEEINTKYIKIIRNKNLGGTGGFTRGLLEAKINNFDLCMFMDDDAFCSPFSICKSYEFLKYSKTKTIAISGAMCDKQNMFNQLEAGAWFYQGCHPLHCNLDIRDPITFIENSKIDLSNKLYGSWWFFMFQISNDLKMPYPYFVRGDDIDFSYKNNFDIQLLNGVCAWQNNFISKENPVSIFLFIRSHILHHLTLSLDQSEQEIKNSIHFILTSHIFRYLKIYRYDYAFAVILAIQFVLAGKQNWNDNLLMANVLKKVKEECNKYSPKIKKVRKIEKSCDFYKRLKIYPITRITRKVTINSILLPSFLLSHKNWVLPKYNWVDEKYLFLKNSYYQEIDTNTFINPEHNLRITTIIILKYFLSLRKFKKNYKFINQDFSQNYQKYLSDKEWMAIFEIN